MEGDDGEHAAGVELAEGEREGVGQGAELVVDRDADALEGAGGRVRAAGAGRGGRGFGDEFGEAGGAGEAAGAAGGDDRVDDAEPAGLLAVVADGAFEFGAVAALEELGGAAADARVHAHVVRRVEAEGETAFRDIQLVRGHPNVHQNTVESPRDAVKVAEIFGMETQAAGMGGEQRGGTFAGRGIAVHRVDRAARRPREDRRGVAAAAEGAVQIGAPVQRSEERQALLEQDWDVAGHAAVCE